MIFRSMRDRRFIAEHRGGPLQKARHIELIKWACDCVEHVLPLLGENPDGRLIHALEVGRGWAAGKFSVGDARRASVEAHAAAREFKDPAAIAVARAAGHAVATAHMADHAPGGAYYALKAVKSAGQSTEAEREWQIRQAVPEIRELVSDAV